MQEKCRETQGAKALPGNWQRGQESGQRPGDEEPLPVFTVPFGQGIGEPLESDKWKKTRPDLYNRRIGIQQVKKLVQLKRTV